MRRWPAGHRLSPPPRPVSPRRPGRAGIGPMITIRHSASPVWIDDPRDPGCAAGPSDDNLCGLGHPVGGPLVIAAFERFARLLGERFGDRVDEWGTLNEPLIYL